MDGRRGHAGPLGGHLAERGLRLVRRDALVRGQRPGYDIDVEAEERRDFLVETDDEPILDPGVDRWFSETVYQRGSVALHALRRTVGDDAFFEILQTWVSEYSAESVTTEQFIEVAEEVSGEDLDEFFQEWLEEEGMPELP